MGKVEFLKFSRRLGAFNRCMNKNVDCVKMIKLLLFDGIKANSITPIVFADTSRAFWGLI